MNSPSLSDIKNLLTQKLQASFVEVTDESGQHAGHAHYQSGQITHIAVSVQSPLFQNQSLIARHRLIYEALNPLTAQGLHAIRIEKT